MCEKRNFLGRTHPGCRRERGMEGLVSAVVYRGLVKRLVTNFKYRYVRDMAGTLVELVETYAETESIGKRAVVVPVPLHPRRERWRGFNQAALLGKATAEYFGWQYSERALVRSKFTKPQMTLKGAERRRILAGAFGEGAEIGRTIGKRVVLVDDVWTTGQRCGSVLKYSSRRGQPKCGGLPWRERD
jgi:ComF family protein